MVFLAPRADPGPDFDAAAQAIEGLPAYLVAHRVSLGLQVAGAADQIGIGRDTLARLELGLSKPTQPTILSCLRWLAGG